VNAISPGALAKLHPLGRIGEIRDIVEAVLYLESASIVTERSSKSTAVRAPVTELSGRRVGGCLEGETQ
jgi:hypothetical protein